MVNSFDYLAVDQSYIDYIIQHVSGLSWNETRNECKNFLVFFDI